MIRYRRALCLAILASLAACGEPTSPSPAAPPAPQADLDDLAALGYAPQELLLEEGPTGVVTFDESRAWHGLNLTTDERSTCLALDMNGQRVHSWHVPVHDQVEHFALLDGGRVVTVSVDQGVTLLERDSTVVWQRALPAHHDVRPTSRGTFLVPLHDESPHAGRVVRFDQVVELDGNGTEIWRWDSREHLDELAALHLPHPLAVPAASKTSKIFDYFHLNSVLELPDGNLLVCLRNVNLIAWLDRSTGRPLRGVGPGILDFPHDPTPLRAGGVLVFDNGYHRGHSRLVELDAEGDLAWSWEARPAEEFFSQVRGACQRLPNGNLLVTESQRGRVFELDAEGEVVWDWRNPAAASEVRRVYRMRRVAASALDR